MTIYIYIYIYIISMIDKIQKQRKNCRKETLYLIITLSQKILVLDLGFVMSHINWECERAYMHKRTILDTTRFKAVMTMNLSELRSEMCLCSTMMCDLLKNLVWESKKRTILCCWGWVVTNGIRAIAQPEMGSVYKLMRVASRHSLGCQEWGDPIRIVIGDVGFQEGGDCDVPYHLRMEMCLYE